MKDLTVILKNQPGTLADMGEGRVWIRLGRVKIDYLMHFALAQT